MGRPALHAAAASPDAQAPRPDRKFEARAFPTTLIVAAALLGGASYHLFAPAGRPATLNQDTFVPYAITGRDVISPASVLLTVRPRRRDTAPPYLTPGPEARWKHALWSVEFKQPELQIARHYTPLPARDGHDDDDDDDDARAGTLRFYVRAVAGGEMSSYLGRLPVGSDVHLRGPHAGFDVLRRLGARRRVVFLAGGTGIVPGMQVARAVLDADAGADVQILWAVRSAGEVRAAAGAGEDAAAPWPPRRGFWGGAARPADLTPGMEGATAIAAELQALQARYGDRLAVRVAVDELRTRFTAGDVQSAVGRGGSTPAAGSGRACKLHDQLLHQQATELEPAAMPCRCAPASSPGKNLFIVSGPEGFVAHYAGQKIWRDGVLTQGPVGGVAAQLQRENASFANDWLVLKL
ncbi:uncharacterized protein UV8b_06906 [Ustilaginoidea virens]|uniref:FAD-binding FR-type domain-containing protein n=1 Tax=Ustilaginoidea virens TaxID=1159556 RepID=A0A8E5HWG2_USTVR|nr:uncharacterized protein UV8b_06906 [Ustilaginoidea virens]QUC22665.1 hypothetical protein UV8b_06906 [Ustilaginoidea virens]